MALHCSYDGTIDGNSGTIPTTGAIAWLYVMQLVTTYGAVIKGYGDGSTFNASYNSSTIPASFSGTGPTVNGAWVRLQINVSGSPVYEILFQAKATGGSTCTLQRCASTFTGTGNGTVSATVAPTGVDPTSLAATLNSAAVWWNGSDHLAVTFDTATGALYLASCPPGGGNVHTVVFFEFAAAGSFAYTGNTPAQTTTDADPWVSGFYYASGGLAASSGMVAQFNASSTALAYSQYRYGLTSPSYQRVTFLQYFDSAFTQSVAPPTNANVQVGLEVINQQEWPLPIYVCKIAGPSTTTTGYKAQCIGLQWSSVYANRVNFQGSTNGTKSWLNVAGMLVPWPASVSFPNV